MSTPVWNRMKGLSPVWKLCEQNNTNKDIRCSKCKKKFASGVSTTTVRSHLDTQHSISVAKVSTDSSKSSPAPKSESGASSFFTTRDTPALVAAQLCAVDRLPFNTVAKSKQIHLGQKARGITLPQTASGVRKAIFSFCDETKGVVKAAIAKKIESDKRFSISVDEYTSSKNRRYMCLNLHGQDSQVISLGMIRIHGTLPSEKAVHLTRKKLDEFGLSVDKHIVGVVSDGASVMKKYARLLGVDHQICHSHGLHLAVCDILYKTVPQDDDGNCESRMNHLNLISLSNLVQRF